MGSRGPPKFSRVSLLLSHTVDVTETQRRRLSFSLVNVSGNSLLTEDGRSSPEPYREILSGDSTTIFLFL